ncbi:MAG TPA: hypothetical protein VFN57_17405 [Thermomicrobiaceae bacterium]|nr:hypothetical protein [Thermomicrobiaceae bacterium]
MRAIGDALRHDDRTARAPLPIVGALGPRRLAPVPAVVTRDLHRQPGMRAV